MFMNINPGGDLSGSEKVWCSAAGMCSGYDLRGGSAGKACTATGAAGPGAVHTRRQSIN